MVICNRRFRCYTITSWTEKHFNLPTLVKWRGFLTSRALALVGDAEGQGSGLLVTSDCGTTEEWASEWGLDGHTFRNEDMHADVTLHWGAFVKW